MSSLPHCLSVFIFETLCFKFFMISMGLYCIQYVLKLKSHSRLNTEKNIHKTIGTQHLQPDIRPRILASLQERFSHFAALADLWMKRNLFGIYPCPLFLYLYSQKNTPSGVSPIQPLQPTVCLTQCFAG